MKNAIKRSVVLVLLISLFSFIQASPKIKQESRIFAQSKTYVKIWVNGLACPFCAYGLEKKVKKLQGVENLFVDLNNGYITFTTPYAKTPSEEILKKLVKEAGFVLRKVKYSNTPFHNK